MIVQVLQHVPFEGPGTIAPFFQHTGSSDRVQIVHLYRGELPVPLGAQDFLVVMGGPMSVHDESEFPWLRAEKQAIEAAIRADRPVLGVCLGAQLIAQVLGAQVRPMGYREIGWHGVERSADWGMTSALPPFPARFMPLHWHGETFDIPAGAVQLGSSQACTNQGFAYGERVIGLQFHLEFDAAAVRRLARAAPHELDGSRHVQSEAEMLAAPERFVQTQALMRALLDHLTRSTA